MDRSIDHDAASLVGEVDTGERLELLSPVLNPALALSWQLRSIGIFIVATPAAIEAIKASGMPGSEMISSQLELNAKNFQQSLASEHSPPSTK